MKLSIITVCFNSGLYIAQTIESVLAQTFSNIEYIIVDGGSDDGTVDIIRRYADVDSRVQWISEPDRGIADAMNKGVARASGDVIAHLNSDDYYINNSVLSMVADRFIQAPSIQWLTGGFDFVTMERKFIRSIRVRHYSFRRLVRANILLHPATFIRRDLFEAVGGFDVSLRYCMDYDLFLRLGKVTPPHVLDAQLTCFRVHPASRSVTDSHKAYAEEYYVRSNFLRKVNRSVFWYFWDYQIKRQLNRFFYSRLRSSNR